MATKVQAGPWVDAGGGRRRWYDGDDLAASAHPDGRWVAFAPAVCDEAAETVLGEGPTGSEGAADACLRAAGYLDDAGASPDPTAAEVLAAMRAQAGADLVAALAKAHAAVDRLTRDATAREGVLARQLDHLRTAERERDEARGIIARLRDVLGAGDGDVVEQARLVMGLALRSRAAADDGIGGHEARAETWRAAHAEALRALAGVTRGESPHPRPRA